MHYYNPAYFKDVRYHVGLASAGRYTFFNYQTYFSKTNATRTLFQTPVH